ncbi:MAG: hypothetical protein F2942_06035 [Actinobacteria bacterium]|uniref:Unannotated protein n=1 Tax=freshwater metagenome TaxID=449393 RepID=A0A6J6QV58_9ZZZZ|nr:hypothetical protein [Actinomycetota bacterium]MSV85805.1 hypothetical protein [Actinomycetota bacterium]MSX75026.1 hypothetical protein [Actinomycetota bacterium]MSY23052.1 hypothetical protein [Actinomycetota bacterium]MTA74258.1 hypothetical protein [Actinomycetota bacterium]
MSDDPTGQFTPPPVPPPYNPAPTGPPSAPPTAWGESTLGSAAVPTTQGFAAQPATAEPKKSRAGLIIGMLVILALVAGAAFVGVATVLNSGPELALTVRTCQIEADGSLTATGSYTGASDSTSLVVKFIEVTTKDLVASDKVTEIRSTGNGNWEGTGKAGDSVQQVTCEITSTKS